MCHFVYVFDTAWYYKCLVVAISLVVWMTDWITIFIAAVKEYMPVNTCPKQLIQVFQWNLQDRLLNYRNWNFAILCCNAKNAIQLSGVGISETASWCRGVGWSFLVILTPVCWWLFFFMASLSAARWVPSACQFVLCYALISAPFVNDCGTWCCFCTESFFRLMLTDFRFSLR